MRKVKLGVITDSCLGKMLDAEKNKGTYQPYLANINVRWGEFDLMNLPQMRFEDHEQERYGIVEGDLIVCEGGEPGRCAIWDGSIPNMKIQKALHRVRAHQGIDIRYIYYWMLLAGKKNLLKNYFTGSTIKHLPGDKLKEILINIPEYNTQIKIANMLAAIDSLIKHNCKINDNLQRQLKLMYDYWFTQFDFPDENGKPYRSSGGAMVWCDELQREIPKGWKVSTLSDIAVLQAKSVMPQEGTAYNHYSIPAFDDTHSPAVEDGKAIASNKYVVHDNSVLVSKLNPQFKRIWLIIDSTDNAICSTEFLPVKATETGVYALYSLLNSDAFSVHLIQNASSSTGSRKRIDPDNCMSYKFPYDQKVFARFDKAIQPLLVKITGIPTETEALVALRDWLLPMLMNGQATISD